MDNLSLKLGFILGVITLFIVLSIAKLSGLDTIF